MKVQSFFCPEETEKRGKSLAGKGFDSRVTWNGNKDSSGEYSAVRAFSAGLSLQF